MQSLVRFNQKANNFSNGNLYHHFLIFSCLIIHRFCKKFLDPNYIFTLTNKKSINIKNSILNFDNTVSDEKLLEKQLLRTYPHTSKFIFSRKFAIFAEKFILPKRNGFSFARANEVCSILKPILELDFQIDSKTVSTMRKLNIACLGCRDSLEINFARRFFTFNKSPYVRGVDLYSEAPEVIVGDMLDLPFENETFDIVISSHSLEHVDNYDLAIQEMRRILKVDGYICIEVPTGWLGKEKNNSHLPIRSNDDIDLWDFVDASVTQEIFKKNSMDLIAKQESKERKRSRIVLKKSI